MAELVDAADLESVVSRRVGSSPTRRTCSENAHFRSRPSSQIGKDGREATLVCITGRVAPGASVSYPVQVRVLPGTRNTFFLECVAYLACERRERL